MTPCQQNVAILVEAARQFSYENRGVLPPSLGRTLDNIDGAIERQSVSLSERNGSLGGTTGTVPRATVTRRPIADYYLCDTDARRNGPPAKPTEQWVNENTLYRYLAHNLVNAIGKYPPTTIMIHEDLNWKGHGDTVNVGFWDGTVRAMDRASAARAIEESRAWIDAAWAERAASEDLQERIDQYGWTPILSRSVTPMKYVGIALLLYAREHDNRLPPTLGNALPYGDDELSLASKARTYLLPRDQHGVAWPGTPTPEWVNANTSYVYLGRNVDLSRMPPEVQNRTIVFHSQRDAPLKHPKSGDVMIAIFLDGHGEILTPAEALPAIAASQKALDAARGSAR